MSIGIIFHSTKEALNKGVIRARFFLINIKTLTEPRFESKTICADHFHDDFGGLGSTFRVSVVSTVLDSLFFKQACELQPRGWLSQRALAADDDS